MTKDEAKEMGRQAYRDGRPLAPALNQQFMAQLFEDEDTRAPFGACVPALEAYVTGWHQENLRAAVNFDFPPDIVAPPYERHVNNLAYRP